MAFKTFPLLLLSLVVFTPSGLSAPAPTPQDVNHNTDTDPTPTSVSDAPPDSDAPPSTVTPFFTPAVFFSDYYTRPRLTQDNAVLMSTAQQDASFHEPTAVYHDLAPQVSPISDDGIQTTPTPDTTSTVDEDALATDSITPSPTVATTAADAADLITSFSVSSTPTATATHSSHSLNPTKTSDGAAHSSHSFDPTKTSDSTIHPTHEHSSDSRTTQQSRKAALIGTILALACISGLVAFAFCMGCHLPPPLRLKRKSLEDGDDSAKDREKTATDKNGKTSAEAPMPDIVVIPVLDSDASPQSSTHAAPPSGQSAPAWNQPQQPQQHQYSAVGEDDSQFEDVTHILSESTFQAEVESMESQDASSSGNRTSNGAASVTAESYATCESRYSSNSGRASQGSEGQPELELEPSFLSMSPPESPVLQTPKQAQYYVVVPGRPRSKTLTQPSSPTFDKRLSSSRSLPARYSNQPGNYSDRMSGSVFEDSEWDIAESYAARYSKSSVVNTGSFVEVLNPVSEHMETVEFGGKNCVLVQGVAI